MVKKIPKKKTKRKAPAKKNTSKRTNKKEKKKNNYNLIIGSVLIAIIILVLSLTIYFNHTILDVQKVKASIRVEEGLSGLNADTDALHFGTVTEDGSSTRTMSITTKQKSRLEIKINEDVDWISVDKNNIIIEPGETIKLKFTGTAPNGFELNKDYETTIKFYFYRVK